MFSRQILYVKQWNLRTKIITLCQNHRITGKHHTYIIENWIQLTKYLHVNTHRLQESPMPRTWWTLCSPTWQTREWIQFKPGQWKMRNWKQEKVKTGSDCTAHSGPFPNQYQHIYIYLTLQQKYKLINFVYLQQLFAEISIFWLNHDGAETSNIYYTTHNQLT